MGAPVGNQFAKGRTPTRRARNALCRVMLANKDKGVQDLDEIWQAQINLAKGGDVSAAKLIIETLDGKPKQQVDTNVSGALGSYVARIPAVSADIESWQTEHRPK